MTYVEAPAMLLAYPTNYSINGQVPRQSNRTTQGIASFYASWRVDQSLWSYQVVARRSVEWFRELHVSSSHVSSLPANANAVLIRSRSPSLCYNCRITMITSSYEVSAHHLGSAASFPVLHLLVHPCSSTA